MLLHRRSMSSHRLYNSYLAHLRFRFLANLLPNREFYINLYNYLTYNDVD